MRSSSALTDRQLIDAALAGDVASFGRLVDRYQQDVLRIAAMALGSADGAEDVVQDAFVKAHRALSSFRPDASFKPWLYRIVINTARNLHRSTSRRNNLRLRMAAVPPVTAEGPDEIAVLLSRREELVAAINRLRPDDRLILTYRWYDQLSEAEIATALGCRRGTVKSRLSRAMTRLRHELAPETSEP